MSEIIGYISLCTLVSIIVSAVIIASVVYLY
ncbi:g067 [Yersinia phage phiR1-37]|nr:hypothetical protein phiR1-37_gp067 [Yersinia phage phiR1-37]CCE26091.1 g067 [Yersinia phage phiR1-37]